MGNDNNSGRTWGTRLATLNGAEDKPVVAGDTVYVAPGVYRELLTCDVSGTAGNPITYIGDVTGEHTDGAGGPVRITGSDNDQTTTRASCIDVSNESYRIFRGFLMDMTTSNVVDLDGDHCTIEDCAFQPGDVATIFCNDTDNTIRRCFIWTNDTQPGIQINVADTSSNNLIENCLLIGGGPAGRMIDLRSVAGVTIRNCTLLDGNAGIRQSVSPAAGTNNVNNCIIMGCAVGMRAVILGEITENYNTFYKNSTDRTNVNVGANSVTYPPLFESPLLQSGAAQVSGFRLPWWFGSLSRWSQIRQITGTGEPDEDLFGLRRPYTHGGPVASLCSWGPVQWTDFRRDTLRAHDGSLSARVKEKSKTHMFVPGVSATSHTISAWAWRTAGYTGHRNPEMVIKQPGQPDRRTVAGGAAGAWVQVTDTFTPAADPPWLTVELWNLCGFTTTTTVSTTSTSTLSTTSTTTQTVSTLTTTTTTLACDVWWDDIR